MSDDPVSWWKVYRWPRARSQVSSASDSFPSASTVASVTPSGVVRPGRSSPGTSLIASRPSQPAVGGPVRTRRLGPEPGDLVGLVVGEVALVPEPLGLLLVVALPGQDVGGHPVQEPPVVGDDHGT